MDKFLKIKLFAYLRDNRGREVEVLFKDNMTIIDLLEELNIEKEKVRIIIVNGRHQKFDYTISPCDEISLFPPVAGG